jgi:hypothetical protein
MAFIEDITVKAVRASCGPFGGPVAAAAGAVAAGGGAKGRKSAAALVRVSRGRWAGVLGGRREGRSRPGLEGGRILGGSIIRRNSLQPRRSAGFWNFFFYYFLDLNGGPTWFLGVFYWNIFTTEFNDESDKNTNSYSVASRNCIVIDIF